MMINKVLIIVGDASEAMDTLYPIFRVQEDGFEPVVAGPEKRNYRMSLHEIPEGWDITKETEGYTIKANISFRDINPDEYIGIFFSGGRAPEYLRYDPDLIRITHHFFEKKKPVGSVCHGVEIPCGAGMVKGRRMTTIAKCRFDLEICGGIYVDEPCVVDGNLASTRGWPDYGQFMGVWIKMLIEARDKWNKK